MRLVQVIVRTLDRLAPAKQRTAHLHTGERGEEAAYFHLRKLGYVIVARNYRSPRRRGEIDLIGWDKDELCFIEVKTKTSKAFIPAEVAVDFEKQHDLREVPGHPTTRFDIVSVYFEGAAPMFEIFKNAFPCETM
jgi:putative endonuclease